MDNMITKSKDPAEDTKHFEEGFEQLKKYKVKLNPEKCIFELSLGKFLGFMVSHWGIEENPKKIRAVIEM